MKYPDSWQRILDIRLGAVLLAVLILSFLALESIILARISAVKKRSLALEYLDKSRALNNDLIVEKIILYGKGLSLLKESFRLNPYDSRTHFEFAEAIVEAASDMNFGSLLDTKTLFGQEVKEERDFFTEAAEQYKAAIAREPANAIYHQRLGQMYDKLGDLAQSESELKKAAMLSPQNLSIYLYLSQYYFKKGRDSDFMKYITKAIELQKVDSGGVVGGEVFVFLNSIGRQDLIAK